MIEIFLSYVNRNAGKNVIDILEEYIDKSLHALSVKEQNGLIQELSLIHIFRNKEEGPQSFIWLSLVWNLRIADLDTCLFFQEKK